MIRREVVERPDTVRELTSASLFDFLKSAWWHQRGGNEGNSGERRAKLLVALIQWAVWGRDPVGRAGQNSSGHNGAEAQWAEGVRGSVCGDGGIDSKRYVGRVA